MAETLPPLDFSGAGTWTRPQGGDSSQLLKADGDYEVTIAEAEPGKSKSSDNYQVKFTLVVNDDDNKGAKLVTYVPYTGMARSDPPRPNAHRLFEVLDSSGTTSEKLSALEQIGRMPIEQICETLKGRTCYVTARAELYEKNGNWSHKVAYFIAKDRYLANKAINAHRTALPESAQTWQARRVGGAPASSSGTANGATAAAAAPASTSQAATDLL